MNKNKMLSGGRENLIGVEGEGSGGEGRKVGGKGEGRGDVVPPCPPLHCNWMRRVLVPDT